MAAGASIHEIDPTALVDGALSPSWAHALATVEVEHRNRTLESQIEQFKVIAKLLAGRGGI